MSLRTEVFNSFANEMVGLSALMGVTCVKLGEPMRPGNSDALEYMEKFLASAQNGPKFGKDGDYSYQLVLDSRNLKIAAALLQPPLTDLEEATRKVAQLREATTRILKSEPVEEANLEELRIFCTNYTNYYHPNF